MDEIEYILGTHCGITFAGIKAASLFGMKKQCEYCLRKYEEHFRRLGFDFMKLKDYGERILVYVYNYTQLQEILFDEANRKFLEGEGYRYDSVEEALQILEFRMAGEAFPHEIGIFLSYPLEDVKGFIAHPNDGVQLVGLWKVYEEAEQKKRIFDVYKKCTQRIRERLLGGERLETIFCKSISGNTAR